MVEMNTGSLKASLARLGPFVAAIALLAALPETWISAQSHGAGYDVSGFDFAPFLFLSAVFAALLLCAGALVVFRGIAWCGLVVLAVGIISIVFALGTRILVTSVADLIPVLAARSQLGDIQVGDGLWIVLLAGIVATFAGAFATFPYVGPAQGSEHQTPATASTSATRPRPGANTEAVLRLLGGQSLARVSESYGLSEEQLLRLRDRFIEAGSRRIDRIRRP